MLTPDELGALVDILSRTPVTLGESVFIRGVLEKLGYAPAPPSGSGPAAGPVSSGASRTSRAMDPEPYQDGPEVPEA